MKIRSVLVALFVMVLALPGWAGETESFDPDEPFRQAFSASLLRSLLNKALDQVEDYVELSGNLAPDQETGERRGRLQLKIYPEGKSKSNQHVTAEGWFRLAPDDTVHDFSFHFKNPEKRSSHSFSPSDDIL